jgi:hypothetical protein
MRFTALTLSGYQSDSDDWIVDLGIHSWSMKQSGTSDSISLKQVRSSFGQRNCGVSTCELLGEAKSDRGDTDTNATRLPVWPLRAHLRSGPSPV